MGNRANFLGGFGTGFYGGVKMAKLFKESMAEYRRDEAAKARLEKLAGVQEKPADLVKPPEIVPPVEQKTDQVTPDAGIGNTQSPSDPIPATETFTKDDFDSAPDTVGIGETVSADLGGMESAPPPPMEIPQMEMPAMNTAG